MKMKRSVLAPIALLLFMAFATVSCNSEGKEENEAETPAMEHQEHTGDAVYACPMHPEVTSDKPGDCSKCGMKLEKQENTK